jgi:hypothetical protein
MVNRKHLAELKKGVESWNKWRKDNLDVKPDSSEVDFTLREVVGADFKPTPMVLGPILSWWGPERRNALTSLL